MHDEGRRARLGTCNQGKLLVQWPLDAKQFQSNAGTTWKMLALENVGIKRTAI